MQVIFIVGGTVLAWVVVLGELFLLRHAPRELGIVANYIWNMCVFLFLAYALRISGVRYAAGSLSVMVVSTLLSLELFYWVFVNPAAAGRYLTVVDWIIPAILAAVTTYLTARLFPVS